MNSIKNKRTQIAFEIHPELRKQIKILAAQRNVSMNLWMAQAIYDRIKKETKNKQLSPSD